MKTVSIMLVAMLALTAPVWATPQINVGTITLLPNQAGQVAYIYVTGGDAVQALEFNVTVNNGQAGPILEGVDIFTGTIFANSNQGAFGGNYIHPHTAYVGTTALDNVDLGVGMGKVAANGLLATLTFDTSGLFSGSFPLLLTNVEGPTNFADVSAAITNGTIVIPEPATMCLLLGAFLPRLARRRR